MNRLHWTNSVTLKYKRMCSRKCCLALGLYQYPRHKPTAYREGVSLGFVLCLYSDDCFPQICFFYFCLPLFHLLTDRGAETRRGGMGRYILPIIWLYPPNNLSIVCICIPPIIWLWCAFERRSPLEFGEQSFLSLGEDLFFGLHFICSPEKNRGRGSSPQSWKQGKIGVKLQVISPNAQQRSAPLLTQRPKRFLV